MNRQPVHNPWRQLAIGAALVTFLIGVYFFTYNGYAISRDEWFLFDATESLARRGDLRQNYQFDIFPPTSLQNVKPPPADTEPLQPVLAVPLFLIAQALPGIGLAHTVWIFNIVITALTAGVLYAYGLALGYRMREAALVAVIFGLGTIVWPYSRTFFREPLFTLLALLSMYLVARIRDRLTAGERPLLGLLGFVAVFAGTLLSKEAALLIVPALVVEAIPARGGRVQLNRRVVITLVLLALVVGGLLLVVLNLDTWFGIEIGRWNLTHRFEQVRDNLSDLSPGIRGYLFSPSRSLWLFSPALLAGLVGCWGLAREHHWRQIFMPLVVLVSFVVGYAAVRGPESWYGGLGWGPRYMVPVTPFLALWLLPVFETLLERGAAWWKRLSLMAVFVVSLGVQLLAIIVPVLHYYYVFKEMYKTQAWRHGVWNWNLSQIRLTWDLLGDYPADFAWNYAVGAVWLLPVLSTLLVLLALAAIVWWIRRDAGSWKAAVFTTGALALAAALVFGFGLYSIRQDPRYYGDFAPTQDLLALLEGELEPGDVVVLNDYIYAEFFMNYYKGEATVYTLSSSPGERSNPDQPAKVESAYPDELVHFSNTLVVADLATRYDRLWLVINGSPFIPWSVRPMEHYLARHYFPIRAIQSTDIARAVLFDLTPAPPATDSAWPVYETNVTFGDSLKLVGYDMPGGTTRRAGDTLPVSLLWETLAPVPQDYNVALFVLTPEGTLVAQRDSFPVNHFEFTQTWRVGSYHRDNHGIALPDNLPPGQYELWAAVYWWQEPENRLAVADSGGELIGDHAVLATITVD
jgi:hypothetical protein